VANYQDGTISVISDATDMVVATVSVGSGPTEVAIDSSTGELFATDYHDNNVSVVSGAAPFQMISRVSVGTGPVAAAYDPSKAEIFVANGGGDTVSAIQSFANSSAASTSQLSRGSLIPGIGNDAVATTLVIALVGLAVGLVIWKRVRHAPA